MRDAAMASKKTPSDISRQQQIIAEARQQQEKLEKTYRIQALKLFPNVCGRCGREFSGKKLRELTVHHRDHNHDHNPPDGSNWELLCIYCHDNEHSRLDVADAYGEIRPEREEAKSGGHQPFADLAALLSSKLKK
jgi:5-methylcytosine-specific restriction endonuclease McrA